MKLYPPTGLRKGHEHTRVSSTSKMTLHYGPDPYRVTPYEPQGRDAASWIIVERGTADVPRYEG